MAVQLTPSGDTWIWYAFAAAVSHIRTTWAIVWVAPRSTCSHCGSLNALDQRVAVLPSAALAAGFPAFSTDDAVVTLPSARFGAPPPPPLPGAGVLDTSLEAGDTPTLLCSSTT